MLYSVVSFEDYHLDVSNPITIPSTRVGGLWAPGDSDSSCCSEVEHFHYSFFVTAE